LSKGYPCCTIADGVYDSDLSVLTGSLDLIRNVAGKPVSDIPPNGSGTVAVWIWNGSAFIVDPQGMTFTGFNTARVPLQAANLAHFVNVDGQFVQRAPENSIFLATANSNIANNASGGFTLSDGRSVTGLNISGDDLYTGNNAIAFQDLYSQSWYAINQHVPLIRFELTSALVYGTNPSGANAKVLVYSSGSYSATGASITVYDWGTFGGTYGNWAGQAPRGGDVGFQGWAVLKTDSNRIEIVWMESMARFIRATLGSSLAATAASLSGCTVNYYWDGRNPDPAGSGITLYNLEDNGGNYQFSGDSGDIVYAVRDDLDRYRIICGLPRGIKRGTVHSVMANSNTTGVVIDGITGVTAADNPMGFACSAGDKCHVASVSGKWEIITVQQHVYTMIVDSSVTSTQFSTTKRDFVGMANAAAASPVTTTWASIATAATYVTNVFTAATNLLKQTKITFSGVGANSSSTDSTIDTGTSC
jgi:hypothetical protein